MNEQTPQEELQVEPETAVIETVEEVVEKTPEQVEEAKEAEKAKGKQRLSDRNKTLTYQAREAQREAKALRRENEELKQANQLKSKPDPDNYVDEDKLEADNQRWGQQEEDRIRADERARVRQQEAGRKKSQSWAEQQEKALESDPNYLAKEKRIISKLKDHAEFVSVESAKTVRDLLNSTKQGTKIVSHFDENPDELEDILELSPIEQLKAITAVETKVLAKTPKTVSSAPTPIESEKGGATRAKAASGIAFDEKKESWKEFCIRRRTK